MNADSNETVDGPEFDDLDSVLATTETIIDRLTPEQAHLPTPCPGFDVASLVDHVLGWSASYAARLSGYELDGDPNDWTSGPDPAGELHAFAGEIMAGYRTGGEPPDRLPVGILLMDYQVHGWDLAVATGQPVRYSDRAAERALVAGKGMLKPEYRGTGKDFGPEVQPPADATVMARLVAFLGRDPSWTPPSP